MPATSAKTRGPKLGPATIRLKNVKGHLYAVSRAANLTAPEVIALWYPLEETVRLFLDAGLDPSCDIDEPLTLDTGTGAYKGVKYYYHASLASGVAERTETIPVDPPRGMPPGRVKWHQGAWCSQVGGHWTPVKRPEL